MGIKKWIRQIIVSGLVLLAAVGVFMFMVKTRPKPRKADMTKPEIVVQVQEVQPQTLNVRVSGTGTVQARATLDLSAQVSGEVVERSDQLEAGGVFAKGELLARLDERPYQWALDRARAQLALTKSQVDNLQKEKANLEANLKVAQEKTELAKKDYERADKMARQQTGSVSERDKNEQAWLTNRSQALNYQNQLNLWPGRLEQARQQVVQAQAQLDEAQWRLEHARIMAPFDGRVLESTVEKGTYLNVGARVARVYASSPIEVPLRLPVEDLLWLEMTGHDGGSSKAMVRYEVGGRVFEWPGRVIRVDSAVDTNARMATAYVEVKNIRAESDGTVLDLLPGMYVEGIIEGRRLEQVFAVNQGYLDQENNAYVAKDGHLEIRPVKIVKTQQGTALVSQGLEAGDLMITSPLATPVEGMAVTIQQPTAKKK